MRRNILSYIITCSAVAALLLAMSACSNDRDPVQPTSRPFPLYPIMGQMYCEPLNTRSFPITIGGKEYPYEGFNEAYPTPIRTEYKTIGIFLAQDTLYDGTILTDEGYTGVDGSQFYYREGYRWGTTVHIESEENYYIYGFMPAMANEGATQAIKRLVDHGTNSLRDWKHGASMTYSHLKSLTGADVSAIVAVKGGDPNLSIDDQKDIVDPTVYGGIEMGNHFYKGVPPAHSGTVTNNNCVYLLLDHLYANINLEMLVDKDYAELRTIKLTRVRMESDNVVSHVDMHLNVNNITLNPDSTVISNMSYRPSADATGITSAELYPIPSEPDEREVCIEGVSWKKDANGDYLLDDGGNKIQDYTSIPGYFAPINENIKLKFTFRYNVYDKKGNLVRENCEAANTWTKTKALLDANGKDLGRGLSFRVKVLIKPTYLYQLSDPDLDNPTIVIQ